MDSTYIFFNGILATPERISMVEGKTEVITVRKEDIKRITLDKGYQAERPILQIVFGVIVLVITLYPMLKFLGVLMGLLRMNVTMTTTGFVILCFVPLGAWMIQSGLKQGYYLSVELENDHRKLGFKTKCKKSELREFVRLMADLGYIVDISNL